MHTHTPRGNYFKVGETGIPQENPDTNGESTQTPHRKTLHKYLTKITEAFVDKMIHLFVNLLIIYTFISHLILQRFI